MRGCLLRSLSCLSSTAWAHAGVASTATLWGQAANGVVLPIDVVAAQAGTVGYELMCALAQRVPVELAE